MRLLYVTGHLRDADFIEHEIHRLVPDSRLDVSPNFEDALQRLASPESYDAVLVDATLPDGPGVRLILHIRQQSLRLATVVLIGSGDENPPLTALDAGADDYIVKRQQYVSRLPSILRAAIERYRASEEQRSHPYRVLFVGDIERYRPQLDANPQLRFEAGQCRSDGSLEQLDQVQTGQLPCDAILVDDAIENVHVLQVLKDAMVRAPEMPLILLVDPANSQAALQAFRIGVSECITKSGEYFDYILPAVRKAVRQRTVLREKAALHSTEARLRLLIESVPACIMLISGDGDIIAVNRSGLPVLGATRLDQVVGRNIRDMVTEEQHPGVREFLERVCAGERRSIRVPCDCLDRQRRALEFRAVPLRREADAKTTVLAAVQEAPAKSGAEAAADGSAPRLLSLEQALKAAAHHQAQSEEAHRLERERGALERGEWERNKSALEEQIRALTERSGALEADSGRLESTVRALEQKLGEAVNERLRAEEKADTQRSLRAAEESEWENRNQRLQSELDAEKKRISDLRAALMAAEDSQAELLTRMQDLELQTQQWRQEHEQAAAARLELQEALRSAESGQTQLLEERELERAQAALEREGWESERSKLQAALAEWELRRQELAQESASHHLERQQIEQRVAELETALREAEHTSLARARAELEQRIAELETALDDAEALRRQQSQEREAERGALEQAKGGLEERVAELERLLGEAEARQATQSQEREAERGALEQAKEELERRVAELNEELRGTEARRSQQWQEREELQRHNTALQARLRDAENRLGEQLRDREAEQAHHAVRQRQLEEYIQKHAGLEDALRAAESRLLEQAEGFDRNRAELERSRQELEDRCRRIEESLRSAEGALAAEAEERAAEKSRLEQLLRDREQQLLRLEEARSTVEQQGTEVQRLQQALQAQLARKAEELNASKAQWELLRQELERSAASAEEKCRTLEGDLAAAQSARHDLIEKHEAELNLLRQASDEVGGQREALQEQLLYLQGELERARAAEVELRQRRESELQEFERALQGLRSRLHSSEEDRSHLARALQSAQSRLGEMEARLASMEALESRARDQEHERARVTEELRRAESERAKLAEAAQKRRLETDALLQEVEGLRAACAGLESSVRTAETHRAQLLEECERLKAEAQRVQKELEQQRNARLVLEDALRTEELTRGRMAEREQYEAGRIEELQRERDQVRSERDRLRKLLDDTSGRYQLLIKQRTEHFHELLRNAAARYQQDAEAQLRLIASQHLEEREALERMLQEAEVRQQQFDEQALGERRRLEGDLTDLQSQYRRLIEHGSLAMALTSLDGRLLNCSESFARLFGYGSSKAALAQPEDWQTRFLTDHRALDARMGAEGKLSSVESCLRAADGRLVWVLENAVVVPPRGDEEAVVERIFVDVSEIHTLKEELRKCRRAESVGKLATATVQTFNDLLNSMSSHSQLLIEGLSEEDPRRRNAERVRKVAGQAGSLARQLLAYSRRQERAPDLIDLNSVIRKMEDLLHSLVGEDIEFSLALPAVLSQIFADRSEIEQVLTAFVVHARDSLPLGGTVSLETENVSIDPTGKGNLPEEFVLCTFHAVGYGVQPISYAPSLEAIIARYGGHIRTSNEPERLSSLRIYLPRVEPGEKAEDAARRLESDWDY